MNMNIRFWRRVNYKMSEGWVVVLPKVHAAIWTLLTLSRRGPLSIALPVKFNLRPDQKTSHSPDISQYDAHKSLASIQNLILPCSCYPKIVILPQMFYRAYLWLNICAWQVLFCTECFKGTFIFVSLKDLKRRLFGADGQVELYIAILYSYIIFLYL